MLRGSRNVILAALLTSMRGIVPLVVLDGHGRIRLFHDGYDASEEVARQIATEIGALQRGLT